MKYEVSGFIRVTMTVEADSDDEAMELATEKFDSTKHLDSEAEPEWEVANEIGGVDLDEDDDSPLRNKRAMRSLDEDEDE